MLSKRDWSMFDRCYSGLLKNKFNNRSVRFLTFTSSPVVMDGLSSLERLELIRINFDSLKKRYEKEFGHSFGDYFRVSTLEGNGVLHILFNGSRIEHNWLVENWNELHGSHIVDIREPRGDPWDGAMYVIGQYIAVQDGKKIFGYSRNWVYSGFTNDLKQCKELCRIWTDERRNCFGIRWYPIDYGRFKHFLSVFLEHRLKGEVISPWEVTHFAQ